MTVVVDASVLVKVFVDEPGSDAARRVVEHNDVLVAPAHALGEVGEVLVRRFADGKVSRHQIGLAIVALRGMIMVVGIEAVLGLAVDIAINTKASVYDSLYVAVAQSQEVPLVTADERLVERMSNTAWARWVRPLDQSGA